MSPNISVKLASNKLSAEDDTRTPFHFTVEPKRLARRQAGRELAT